MKISSSDGSISSKLCQIQRWYLIILILPLDKIWDLDQLLTNFQFNCKCQMFSNKGSWQNFSNVHRRLLVYKWERNCIIHKTISIQKEIQLTRSISEREIFLIDIQFNCRNSKDTIRLKFYSRGREITAIGRVKLRIINEIILKKKK